MHNGKITRTTVTEIWMIDENENKTMILSRSICEENMTDDGYWENTNAMMLIKPDSNKYFICKGEDN